MKLATYDKARQWLKDKPRRMKANPAAHLRGSIHSIEHDWSTWCDIFPKCLPVDAPVETHDGVTTDGHGKLLGGQGSEPRNDEPFHGCRLCAECGLPIMPNAPSKQFNLKGKEICYTCFEKPTPPPASAPVPHWLCEKCGKLEPSQVENGDVCRVCGGAVMWFEPVAGAPKHTPGNPVCEHGADFGKGCEKCRPAPVPPCNKVCGDAFCHLSQGHDGECKPTPAPGTPVERWLLANDWQHLVRLDEEGMSVIRRLCALLTKQERKGQEAQRYWMEIVAETQKDAQEQRTRVDRLEKQINYIGKALDKYCENGKVKMEDAAAFVALCGVIEGARLKLKEEA